MGFIFYIRTVSYLYFIFIICLLYVFYVDCIYGLKAYFVFFINYDFLLIFYLVK